MPDMVTKFCGFVIASVCAMTFPASVDAQTRTSTPTAEPIRYTLSFPAPHTHYVHVSAVVPTGGRPTVDLMMAVCSPVSYLVLEYERHVDNVAAADANGTRIALVKTLMNLWWVSN